MAAITNVSFTGQKPQAQWTGTQLNPALWTVEVKLQNNKYTYLQFNTQKEAQADIQKHNYGTLIAPGNKPGQTNAATPNNNPVAAKQFPQRQPQSTWKAQGLNLALWTVEVQVQGKWKYIQYNTQAGAQGDITKHKAGTLMRPNPAAAQATPNSTPKPPVAPATPVTPPTPATNTGANKTLPYSSFGWVRVKAGTKTWQFDKANEAGARKAFAWAQSKGMNPVYQPYNKNPGNMVTRFPQGFNPPGPNYA